MFLLLLKLFLLLLLCLLLFQLLFFFVCVCFCLMLLLSLDVVMLLSKQEGGKQTDINGGGQKVEQLPGKIKGDSYVSKCENYGVFVFDVFMYASSERL